MNTLRQHLAPNRESVDSASTESFPWTSGALITQLAGGANLVDGVQTWQHADLQKDNLEVMLRCCDAELETMARTKLVAAPFYFERAAILYRKSKNFDREVRLCEGYITAIEDYYRTVAQGHEADVRKGPRFQAIQSRLVKARKLLSGCVR